MEHKKSGCDTRSGRLSLPTGTIGLQSTDPPTYSGPPTDVLSALSVLGSAQSEGRARSETVTELSARTELPSVSMDE